MKDSAPERGAGSDDSHRATDLWKDSPSGTPWPGVVRTGSSNAEVNQSCPVSVSSENTPLSACDAKTQSERGLDSAERSPDGEPEARASGKSDGTRSDRSETSSGGCGELSAGWREVAEQLHAEEGTGHE